MVNKLLIFSLLISFSLNMMAPEELSEVKLKDVKTVGEALTLVTQYVKNICRGKSASHPSNSGTYIKSIEITPGVEYLQDYIQKDSLGSILTKNGFPKQLVTLMKGMKFSTESFGHDIDYNSPNGNKDTYTINKYLGAAYQFDNYVLYGLYHANIRAHLKELYNIVPRTVTYRSWKCLKLCKKKKTVYDKVRREPTVTEKQVIEKELEAKSLEIIKAKAVYL